MTKVKITISFWGISEKWYLKLDGLYETQIEEYFAKGLIAKYNLAEIHPNIWE